MHQFLKFIFGIKLYMFRTVPLSIIRSFSLYTQQWYMSYRFADSLRAGSGWNLQLQRNCPKHVEFHSKNKSEKLVHLIAFHPDPARKLSANLYDIYHCCVYSEKLLMMGRGTVQNMSSFIQRINLRN